MNEFTNHKPSQIFTIGHSTRSMAEFFDLLEQHHIDFLVDVRSFPGSKHSPQFNREMMSSWLPENGIEYLHLPLLGGRRGKPAADPHLIKGWTHPSFSNYAGYMMTPDFTRGLDELIDLSKIRRVAYMCSEAVWWKCHRRMISDALVVKGFDVQHIMDSGLSTHALTDFAVVTDGALTYPETQMVLALGGEMS